MNEQLTFFDAAPAYQPLAARLRPQTLDEVVGQRHLIGPGKLLRRMIESDGVSSMIFWGPPGVGKTTLAHVIARATKSGFIEFSAVTSGIREIRQVMEQAERNRVIANTLQYEEGSIGEAVAKMTGGTMHFPVGYDLKKTTDDFMWIADEKQYTIQGVFVYKYPVTDGEPFTVEKMVARRNEFLKDNVPGMFANTYMTTSEFITPGVKFLKYKGIDFAEMRGLWEVYNDYMGGPFVSHSFYSRDGKEIIVLESWVYAAKYDKRQYLRQVESLLYSFEWPSTDSTPQP